jgi:cell division transport system ATP-binding protein
MIRLENVTKEYTPGIAALSNVNIEIERGEFVFVVGDSGCGKTTLVKLLTKELEPTKGRVVVNGKDLSKIKRKQVPRYRRNVGCVFQDFRLLKDRNVYENVAFAERIVSRSSRQIHRDVPKMLSMVGLAQKYRSKPNQLSGGEQQRVAIARALINQPKVLLADEPTGNLDENNAWEIMKLLDEINQRGTTVVVVTHNLNIVRAMKKRVITLQLGNVISDVQMGGDKDEA